MSSINSTKFQQSPLEAGKASGEAPGRSKTVTAQTGQLTLPILIGYNCQSSKQPRLRVVGHGNIGRWLRSARMGILFPAASEQPLNSP